MKEYIIWNNDALKRDANCLALVREFGLPIKKIGSSYFTSCLVHNEKTASMQINKTYLYCHGCGKSINAIDLCMIANNESFQEACQTVAESIGSFDDYLQKGAPEKKDIFPLTKDELIAVNLNPTMTKHLYEESTYIVEEEKSFEIEEVSYDAGIAGIKNLFKENKDAFWNLIERKSFEAKQLIEDEIVSLKDETEDWAQKLYEENVKRKSIIIEVQNKIPNRER